MTEAAGTHRRIARDVRLSVLLGPTRLLVPAAGYAVLYPVIIARYDLAVLGVWSLLASVAALFAAGDVGFTQTLARDAGSSAPEDVERTAKDYAAGRTFFAALLVVSTTLAVPVAWAVSDGEQYSRTGLALSTAFVCAGAALQLLARLDGALLAAHQDNTFTNVVLGFAPLGMFGLGLSGALVGYPIEGLAGGSFVAGAVAYGAVHRRARRRGLLPARGPARPLRERATALYQSTRRGWHFYTMSVGMIIRFPLWRFVIATCAGLPAAAVFDIALRICQTIRDVAASGFSVLLPTFGHYHRTGDKARMVAASQNTLLVLVPAGATMLAGFLSLESALLPLWLPEVPRDLPGAITLMGLWTFITLFNVPFWYALQASGLERVASRSIWLHSASLLLMLPAQAIFAPSLIALLTYWIATSVLTQAAIYLKAHESLGLVAPTFVPTVLAVSLLSLGLLAGTATLALLERSLAVRLAFCVPGAAVVALVWFRTGAGRFRENLRRIAGAAERRGLQEEEREEQREVEELLSDEERREDHHREERRQPDPV